MRLTAAILLLSCSLSVLAAPSAPKKTLPINKIEESVKKDQGKNKEPNALDKKPADCDTKAAAKPVEITPESISLSGNTGCSLDEAQP
jgi:hypothetical protein